MATEFVDINDLTVNEIISTELINDILNNLEFLHEPPQGLYEILPTGSDITTTSTSFVDMTGFTRTVTTDGGIVEVSFDGRIDHSGSSGVAIDVLVDGVSMSAGATDGIAKNGRVDLIPTISFTRHFMLAAGAHTIKLQWRTLVAGTATLRATSNPQFYVRER